MAKHFTIGKAIDFFFDVVGGGGGSALDMFTTSEDKHQEG
jgi:hypothetical protein